MITCCPPQYGRNVIAYLPKEIIGGGQNIPHLAVSLMHQRNRNYDHQIMRNFDFRPKPSQFLSQLTVKSVLGPEIEIHNDLAIGISISWMRWKWLWERNKWIFGLIGVSCLLQKSNFCYKQKKICSDSEAERGLGRKSKFLMIWWSEFRFLGCIGEASRRGTK